VAHRCTSPEYLLAEMHRDGRGIHSDKATSYMWFAIAEAISAKRWLIWRGN
jgi:hypothetical protein